MKWKIFLLSGVFIILEYCFSTVKADCIESTSGEKEEVEKKIKAFRKDYFGEADNYQVEWTVGEPVKNKLEAVLEDDSVQDTAEFLHYKHGENLITTADIDDIIDGWINTGELYKVGGPLTEEYYPFIKLLWKETSKATCGICKATTSNSYGFGCVFEPPVDLQATSAKIEENLPKKLNETADGDADNRGGNVGNEGKGGNEGKTGNESKAGNEAKGGHEAKGSKWGNEGKEVKVSKEADVGKEIGVGKESDVDKASDAGKEGKESKKGKKGKKGKKNKEGKENQAGDSPDSSSKKGFSEFEKTVRTSLLILTGVTVTIVTAGSVFTILVAIQIFGL